MRASARLTLEAFTCAHSFIDLTSATLADYAVQSSFQRPSKRGCVQPLPYPRAATSISASLRAACCRLAHVPAGCPAFSRRVRAAARRSQRTTPCASCRTDSCWPRRRVETELAERLLTELREHGGTGERANAPRGHAARAARSTHLAPGRGTQLGATCGCAGQGVAVAPRAPRTQACGCGTPRAG